MLLLVVQTAVELLQVVVLAAAVGAAWSWVAAQTSLLVHPAGVKHHQKGKGLLTHR